MQTEFAWGEKEQGSAWSFRRRRKRREAEFAPTRRKPSDAKMNLWQAELETLK